MVCTSLKEVHSKSAYSSSSCRCLEHEYIAVWLTGIVPAGACIRKTGSAIDDIIPIILCTKYMYNAFRCLYRKSQQIHTHLHAYASGVDQSVMMHTNITDFY